MRYQPIQLVEPDSRIDAVRQFYDLLPYPAPVSDLDGYRKLWQDQDRSRWLFRLFWPSGMFCEDQDILVAGCGTSQAAKHAMREPKARVTAIDLSKTSIRHTRDLKEKYGLDNLEVHQLSVPQLVHDIGDGTFRHVHSFGNGLIRMSLQK